MVVKVFTKIIESKNNRINIAIKRLNLCYERENEEDAIIDVTIAIEALLSDDNNQEITHKLALRIAALSKYDTMVKEAPNVIFEQIKKIYSFRSAVVHGSSSANKKKEIKLSTKEVVPAVKKGTEYIRMVIRVLLNYPRYQDPKLIDSELLLGRKIQK
jgi:lipopolysaccharide biosynthesis regulator YciM